jgi:RNA polymerase sigma-70 factor (ECF subfamily)
VAAPHHHEPVPRPGAAAGAHPVRPLPDDAERIAGTGQAGLENPAQHYDDTHFDADVQRALDALPPDFRAAVVLCDLEGLSYEEIAATLGIKIGTVRSRIHRGRSQLRAALAHRAPGAHDVSPSPDLRP